MTHYRQQIRVPRKQLLRALFSKRGLLLTIRAESDGDFIAAVDTIPPEPKGEAVPSPEVPR